MTKAGNCWNCGQPVEVECTPAGAPVCYECIACDVLWRASPYLSGTFTDPVIMSQGRPVPYIDHGTVYVPCP